ncbi:MAG: hypothetical protein MI865_09240 [Proteobacteria bacterium]|nr:hypothetical protein [Pseudomonadota bacterium]
MSDLFIYLFSTALVNNLVLSYLVGLDLQVAASQRINAAKLIGLATVYCLSLILPGVYLLNQLVIIPLQLQYLDLLFYVMLIIFVVLLSHKIIQRSFPLIFKQVDSVAPILLMNSTLLAVILLNQIKPTSFFGSLFYGLVTGIGFLFLLLVLTCLRERIDNENIPEPFRGFPVLLIALGIFSMGLMGLAGLQ